MGKADWIDWEAAIKREGLPAALRRFIEEGIPPGEERDIVWDVLIERLPIIAAAKKYHHGQHHVSAVVKKWGRKFI